MSELSFVESSNPLPTVELDLDSLPDNMFGYGDLVPQSLQAFAANNLDVRATIYVFQGQSVNFHKPTFSVFFIVAGKSKQKILDILFRAFNMIKGVKVKSSDHIPTSMGIREFHIEGGSVWCPIDSVSWSSYEAGDHIVENSGIGDANSTMEAIDIGSDSETLPTGGTRLATPTRTRIARADASVGSIQSKIEEVFGLPEGSVVLSGPNGKALRSDAKIATLRKRWGQ